MKIDVKTSTNKYDVIIENGVLNRVNELVSLKGKVLIVSDDKVPFKYVETLKKQIENPFVFIFPSGEKSKNINTYSQILSFMIENNFTRSDIIIALGGGVVGDLAGFVAATFNRGITFINIPTTLLSQVDSSIGGKTAIDFEGIKNVVGSFYPPSIVIIDPETLSTLDDRQFNAGMAEVIKMALTCNASLFETIKNSEDIKKEISQIIYQALLIKKSVVEQDELEKGLRKVLNFGHSIGHAVEASSELLHGECIAIGMLYFLDESIKNEVIKVLEKFNLPTSCNVDSKTLLSLIAHDKKASGKNIDIVRVSKIGTYEIKQVLIDDLINYM